MYVHGVPKQKEAGDVHVHIEIHVILYNRFNYCKPATIYMNHILIFYPSKFVCVFVLGGGGGVMRFIHFCTRIALTTTRFFTDPFRAL